MGALASSWGLANGRQWRVAFENWLIAQYWIVSLVLFQRNCKYEELRQLMWILWGEETPHQPVSPPDHSLMCGHPHCPQISDLTLSLQHSAALQCSVVYSLQMLLPHSNYLNLHYASVYQNYSFFELEVFFYGHGVGVLWNQNLIQSQTDVMEVDVDKEGWVGLRQDSLETFPSPVPCLGWSLHLLKQLSNFK